MLLPTELLLLLGNAPENFQISGYHSCWAFNLGIHKLYEDLVLWQNVILSTYTLRYWIITLQERTSTGDLNCRPRTIYRTCRLGTGTSTTVVLPGTTSTSVTISNLNFPRVQGSVRRTFRNVFLWISRSVTIEIPPPPPPFKPALTSSFPHAIKNFLVRIKKFFMFPGEILARALKKTSSTTLWFLNNGTPQMWQALVTNLYIGKIPGSSWWQHSSSCRWRLPSSFLTALSYDFCIEDTSHNSGNTMRIETGL